MNEFKLLNFSSLLILEFEMLERINSSLILEGQGMGEKRFL